MSLIQSTYGVCDNCGSETELVQTRCYLCRRLSEKQRNVRVGGAVFIVMGVIVIVMMGVIIHAVSQPVLKNGSRVLSPRAEQALPILYGVLAYGIAALIAGLWHVFTGKANKILLYVVSGTGVLIAIVAKIINIAK